MVRSRKPPETVADTFAAATANGVPSRAAHAFVSATTKDRHHARAKAFVDAAYEEYLRVTGQRRVKLSQFSQRESIRYAIAFLVLDAFGLVSATGPTEETTKIHHRAFRTGCGPRIGPIAPATHAAAREAVDMLYADLFAMEHAALPQPKRGCPFITLSPCVAHAGITVKPSACEPVLLRVEPTGAENSQAPGWLKTIAIEGLRRAMGSRPWFELRDERKPKPGEARPSASIFDLVIFDGSAGEWGVVLDAIIERERVDRVAEQVTQIVSKTNLDEPLFWLPAWKPAPRQRVGLGYIEQWLLMALGDESAMPVIQAARSEAGGIEGAWNRVTHDEFDWMTRFKGMAATMTTLSPKLGSAQWSRDWLSFSVLLMIASAISSSSEPQLGYAERAVRALHRFGVPVLSPEPSLGLQFDECEGVVLLDAAAPASKFAVRQHGQAIAKHIIEMFEKRPAGGAAVEHLCGARIIGTLDEWRAVYHTLLTDVDPAT